MEDKGKIINDLNTRQWRLYDYLKEQHKALSRKEIGEALGYESMRLLTSDLQKIKNSDRITKVLITDRKGIILAQTREDANDYFDREKKEILSRLKRLIKQERQLSHDGQMLITFGNEKDVYMALNVEADNE